MEYTDTDFCAIYLLISNRTKEAQLGKGFALFITLSTIVE